MTILESPLTKELKKLGFLCGIERIVYTREIGKYTMLVIEGRKIPPSIYYVYTFYKQRCYPNGRQFFEVYCEDVPPKTLLRRVRSYADFLQHGRSKGS